MHRRRSLMYSLASAAILYITQLTGIYLANRFGDHNAFFTLSHFVGGVTVGFGVLYLSQLFSVRLTLLIALLLVLAVGIGWEVYEYLGGFGITGPDTVVDIIADVLGGALAYRLIEQEK